MTVFNFGSENKLGQVGYQQLKVITGLVFSAIGVFLIFVPTVFALSSFIAGEAIDIIIGFLVMSVFEITLVVYLLCKMDKKAYSVTTKGIIGECKRETVLVNWEQVRFIGFYYYPLWMPLKILIISTYWDEAILKKRLAGMKKTLGNTVFLEYRTELLEEIKQYWQGEILYEERYVKKKRKQYKG